MTTTIKFPTSQANAARRGQAQQAAEIKYLETRVIDLEELIDLAIANLAADAEVRLISRDGVEVIAQRVGAVQ